MIVLLNWNIKIHSKLLKQLCLLPVGVIILSQACSFLQIPSGFPVIYIISWFYEEYYACEKQRALSAQSKLIQVCLVNRWLVNV